MHEDVKTFAALSVCSFDRAQLLRWKWSEVAGDGNCWWHACAAVLRNTWMSVKNAALPFVSTKHLGQYYPKIDLGEIQVHHRPNGVFADETMLLATALSADMRIVVFDEENSLLYNIEPHGATKCAAFKLVGEHYSPLQNAQLETFAQWVDQQPWAWTPMFKNQSKQPRLLGGSGSHSLSSIKLRPYRSGVAALRWDKNDDLDEPDIPELPSAWRAKVANAQGLRTALPQLLADEPDCCLCSETNIPKSDLPDTDAACREYGYTAVHCAAPPSGLTLLIKQPLRAVQLDAPEDLQTWVSKGRVMACSLLQPTGDLLSVIVGIYVPAGYYKYQDTRVQVDKLWQDVANWVRAMGNVPLILAGDWNAHWKDHLPVRDLVDSGTLADLMELMEAAPRRATFGQSGVLDHILASPHLIQKLTAASTSDITFPADHCALECSFSMEPSGVRGWPRLRYANPQTSQNL